MTPKLEVEPVLVTDGYPAYTVASSDMTPQTAREVDLATFWGGGGLFAGFVATCALVTLTRALLGPRRPLPRPVPEDATAEKLPRRAWPRVSHMKGHWAPVITCTECRTVFAPVKRVQAKEDGESPSWYRYDDQSREMYDSPCHHCGATLRHFGGATHYTVKGVRADVARWKHGVGWELRSTQPTWTDDNDDNDMLAHNRKLLEKQ